MMRFPTKHEIWFTFALFYMTMAATVPVRAEEGLQTINSPSGGKILYGPLETQTSLSNAFGTVLHKISERFGARPQIGRLFRARNSDSVATFLTLTPKSTGAKPIVGMVIVSSPTGAKPAAALLYDDADRFGKTLPAMMKTLNEAWKPASATSAPEFGGANSAHTAKPMPLHQTPFPDGSGSIGLPDGWHITLAARGGVHANGPKGEEIHLGVIDTGIYDTNNPRARASLQYLSRAGKPYLACPYGDDLVSAYRTVAQQIHQIKHTPVPTLNVINVTPIPAVPPGTAEAIVVGDLDNHDGKGPQRISMRLGTLRPGALGEWALCINAITVPKPLAEEEWSTMKAIVGSWRQNGAVIQHQTDVEIGKIHEIGKQVNDRINSQHAANDAHNAAVYKQWDNQEKYSKSFQHYLLDQTVVQDNSTGEHGTLWNQYADSLVKNDPGRFQYVNTPDFIKGVDH